MEGVEGLEGFNQEERADRGLAFAKFVIANVSRLWFGK
jgi:hypothetical protein